MPIAAEPIITLDQAKTFLNITSADFDTELPDFIATASQMIVNRIGQVAGSQTVDEWHDGGSERIVLRNQSPIQSVTSITESYGTISYTLTQITLDTGSVGNGAFEYTVDLNTGVIVRRASGVAVCFTPGIRNIHVTYVSGYASVPADITQATQLLVQHLWTTQRGSGTARPGLAGADANPGAMYSWPYRVEEILAAYDLPGIG